MVVKSPLLHQQYPLGFYIQVTWCRKNSWISHCCAVRTHCTFESNFDTTSTRHLASPIERVLEATEALHTNIQEETRLCRLVQVTIVKSLLLTTSASRYRMVWLHEEKADSLSHYAFGAGTIKKGTSDAVWYRRDLIKKRKYVVSGRLSRRIERCAIQFWKSCACCNKWESGWPQYIMS